MEPHENLQPVEQAKDSRFKSLRRIQPTEKGTVALSTKERFDRIVSGILSPQSAARRLPDGLKKKPACKFDIFVTHQCFYSNCEELFFKSENPFQSIVAELLADDLAGQKSKAIPFWKAKAIRGVLPPPKKFNKVFLEKESESYSLCQADLLRTMGNDGLRNELLVVGQEVVFEDAETQSVLYGTIAGKKDGFCEIRIQSVPPMTFLVSEMRIKNISNSIMLEPVDPKVVSCIVSVLDYQLKAIETLKSLNDQAAQLKEQGQEPSKDSELMSNLAWIVSVVNLFEFSIVSLIAKFHFNGRTYNNGYLESKFQETLASLMQVGLNFGKPDLEKIIKEIGLDVQLDRSEPVVKLFMKHSNSILGSLGDSLNERERTQNLALLGNVSKALQIELYQKLLDAQEAARKRLKANHE